MDEQVEAFYRSVYEDLTVSPEEAEILVSFFEEMNPPPDKLVWLRATAFRLGCEFLSDDDQHSNVKLLRAINALVHSLEQTTMAPNASSSGSSSAYDDDAAQEFFSGIFSDLSIDQEENADLVAWFEANVPPEDSLVSMRATAFKSAVDHLSDDKDANTKLLRCINVVVHNFEQACFEPKEYDLTKTVSLDPSLLSCISLGDAVQELWNLDVNRLKPHVDYDINVQEGKKPFWKEDKAEDPLFSYVDERQAMNRPTYKSFVALLDNYEPNTGEAEHVSSVERREIDKFLSAVLQTAPMQYCHQYLVANCKEMDIPESRSEFQELLYKIWFELYRREGRSNDSSGFEHVFVGEIKDGKISGMHNWVQIYLEEKKGNFDYKGYVYPKSNSDADTNSDDHLLSLQFTWHGVEKFVGTSFIGVSPEFEMALYTLCFLMGDEENHVSLDTGTGDTFDLNIRCYKMAHDKVGTAFPEATAHYD
eukprot:CAMPEP_0113489350 /NCGR_PEP_ID=MMETSP0014_2-20120614/26483_1 /TAXON_ID=2857 /ORGANISM="Nitzschia sp." /LENGTH=476 /DNA_ID=CAMNT_0000383083 /DNA_START=104 /DNA_END=1534 /DNA_ORIENTATION=+ /assembly_acc=CAM_ASM_000159